jgi:hypothetical protein
VDALDRFDPDAVERALARDPGHACGGGPIVSVMRAARALGAADARVLCYADSGAVSGDTSAVVGYCAAVFGTFGRRPDGKENGGDPTRRTIADGCHRGVLPG